ncbi:hypothetical protein KUCAC02_008417 [Chaenocephalus aceratus]|uniref:Uncharacterized protein n=1 Tax=Chaenocephalus aceratus TaxID=36190 RepID=A0ACB9X9R9_CHAAC|nr:hypothetical protein KUCAC02_008417 [Chaenocephalus aceratus]
MPTATLLSCEVLHNHYSILRGRLTPPKRQCYNRDVGPRWCELGPVCGVTNGTPEPHCNVTSVVGPPNHSECPTSSVRFQIPGGVIVELWPSGAEVSGLL